jgi:hypothetical protein
MDPDPASLNYYEAIYSPPKGAILVEWYEFLGIMIIWDLARSVFTAWLTKAWLSKKKKDKVD